MAGSDQEPVIRREVHGNALVLTLNRPSRRNALINESWSALRGWLEQVTEDPAVRVVVITGDSGFFSAGGDLKVPPVHGSGPLSPAGRVENAQRALARIRESHVPVVAAVEGGALGLGWSLALACDLVVVARDGWFAAPFVERAVVPDGGLARRLTILLGRHRAANVLFLGRRVGAEEAHSLGLVSTVVDPGTALSAALSIAETLSQRDRDALELTKRLLVASESSSEEVFSALELATAVVTQQGPTAARAREHFA
jgi:enoyl-CoA hydratase/carnithine racemase